MADDPKDWGAQPVGGEDPTAWGAQPVDAAPRQVAPSGGFTDRLGRGLHAVAGAMESFSRAVHHDADDERLGSMVSRAIPDISEMFSGAVHDTLKAPGQIVGLSGTTSFDDIRPTIKQKLMDTGFDEATAQRKTDELIERYAHQEGMTNLIMGPLTALVSPIFGAFRSTVSKPIEETTGFPKEATEMGVMVGLGLAGMRTTKAHVEALQRNPDNKLTRVRVEPDGRVSAEVVGDLPAESDFAAAGHALNQKPAIIGGGDWNGLELNYEVRAGGKRQNVAPDGSTYETSYTADYGEIKGTRGGDGDPLDFYMGPNPESQRVFVVDEISQSTGKWKQTKPMLGFNSEEEAVAGYLGTSTKSPKSVGAVTEMTVDEFKQAVGSRRLEQPLAAPSLIEKRVREMYEERGVHPAEVVEDAQRDAFVRSELAPPSFDAFHGSPAQFARFDLALARSGEGSNVYGHGVYLAEEPKVATNYRFHGKARDLDLPAPERHAALFLRQRGGDRALAIEKLQENIRISTEDGLPHEAEIDRKAVALLTGGWEPPHEVLGSLYGVRAFADQRYMIDLDRPLTEQPAVMERVARDQALFGKYEPWMTGDDFRRELEHGQHGLSAETISNRLNDVGVPGYKYFDEHSRPGSPENTGRGTRNFVIFDPRRIEITHKNGVELGRGDRYAATNSPVMPGTPLTDLARTGEAHIDAVLNDPVVKRAIDNAVISRDYDVPNGAGASTPAPDPTIYIDRRFPRTMEVDGVRFDPAEPFIIRETVAQHVTDALVDGGMDRATAQRVARAEYAAKAEAQWYASHAIDQAAAEAAYKPILERAEGAHLPPNLDEAPPPPAKDELSVRSAKSSTLRERADPHAHEIQLVDASGKVHYRGEITREGGGLWGVGYVENVSRKYSGLAERLYAEMARYVAERGGRLIAGMDTNNFSQPVLDKLKAAGNATPVNLFGRDDLLEIRAPELEPKVNPAELADAKAILGGEGSPIAEALDQMPAGRSRLVEVPEGDIMLRSGERPDIGNTLEISRVDFEGNEGKGAFTRYLGELEQQATDRGFDAVYVEQIHNKRLEAFLRRRGYRDAPAVVKPDQATLYKPVNIDPREDLWGLIKINAPLELIEQHPLVRLAYEESQALPETGKAEDFKNPRWRASRTYDFNGERVQGTDAAVRRLMEQSRAYAGGEVGTDRRAILLIGPPAAGKSSIADVVAKHRRAAIIDADEAKQVIPEFRGGIGASAVHEESSTMAKEMLPLWMDNGSNIILPKIGAEPESIRGLTEALQGKGYTVDLIHVAATPEISRLRNIIRFLQVGRLVNPDYVARVGDKPRDTFYLLRNEGLYDETADFSTVSRQPTVISGDGPVAAIFRGRDGGAEYSAASGGDQGSARAAAAGADLTRPENLTSPRLRQQPAPPPGSYVNSARAGVDRLMGLGRSIQYMFDPMATGSKAAMVIAKDAISVVRRIHWEHGRLDNEITRRFSPEQWERMWNAADEESVLVKSGEKGLGASENMGLNTLTREERMFVDYIQADSQEAWLHALDVGMVEGEGLPSYSPRMVLNVTAGLEEGSPRALNELGRNVFTRTSQMKHRRHLLAEDTEAAAREMVAKRLTERGASAEDIAAAVDKVKIARNIRSLPLAAARLKEAAVWRDMINKIEDHGKASGQPTVWTGEAPGEGWFTIEGNPAFTRWEPVTEKVQDLAGAPYWQPVLNSAGETVMRRVPIYLSDEFKGPMNAILDDGWRATMTLMGVEMPTPYGALMAIKSRAMLALLNSPMIHNAVVWSKVMEAAGGREWLGFGLYGRGNRIVNGPPQRARELIERGLSPMGPRGAFQDISSMMEGPTITDSHNVSWTGKLLSVVPHLFDAVVNREPKALTLGESIPKMRALLAAGKDVPAIAKELNISSARVDTFKRAHDLVQSIAAPISPTEASPLWNEIYSQWQYKYPGAKAAPGHITDFVSRMSKDDLEGLIARMSPEERTEFNARQAGAGTEGATLPERETGALRLAYSDAEEVGGIKMGAGDAVERAIAATGNFYHNTLLWDRVRDVQFGLADFLSDRLVGKGVDRLTADRVASHFSNIIVGSIPKEAMSSGARGWANLLMFSRSFTLGNLSTYKQAAVGLPKPVMAQIERDFGIRAPEGATPEVLESLQAQVRKDARSIARRKAVATLVLSYALYQIGNALIQHALNIFANDSTGEEEMRGYARRFADLMNDVKSNPFELRHTLSRLNPTADNEPHKGDRILIGYDKDGSAIFARNPTGKFGEELVGYPTMPAEMIRRKMSPMAGGLLDILENNKGFGHKIYDENDSTLSGDAKTAYNVAKHLVMKHLPEQQITGAIDLLRGEGDPLVNKFRAFGPLGGFTVSVGAPGGPARGEVLGEKQQFDARFNLHWPDISKQIKRGDVEGARAAMNALGVTPRMQEGLIRNALDPSGALRGSTLRNFYMRATPQQIERFERARERQPGPRQPGATP